MTTNSDHSKRVIPRSAKDFSRIRDRMSIGRLRSVGERKRVRGIIIIATHRAPLIRESSYPRPLSTDKRTKLTHQQSLDLLSFLNTSFSCWHVE